MIIFLLYFQDILIILLLFFLFWFNCGYSANDRLDFALTVIKRHYNTNDRLKFILSFIRRDNGLNKQLKMEEKKIESERDEDESKQNKK